MPSFTTKEISIAHKAQAYLYLASGAFRKGILYAVAYQLIDYQATEYSFVDSQKDLIHAEAKLNGSLVGLIGVKKEANGQALHVGPKVYLGNII
jgi:hypothetical protein